MKNVLLLLFLLCIARPLTGQDKFVYQEYKLKSILSTRLGLNSLTEINLQYERPLNEKLGWSLYIGYNYGPGYFGRGGLFCAFEPGLIATKKRGFIIKSGIVFLDNPEGSNSTWSLMLDYRRSFIDNLEIDQACGSGSSSFGPASEEFDWSTHDVGIMTYRDVLGMEDSGGNFYFGFGAGVRFEKKEYIETFRSSFEAGQVENNVRFIFRIDVGVRMKIMNYKLEAQKIGQ